MAEIYALCCLLFAALNDFVFKLFARKDRSRGLFVLICGIIWIFCLMWGPLFNGMQNLKVTLIYGVISGILSVLSNLLLIEAMGKQSAGVCSTIYRLNMVIVVIAAILFLGEKVDGWQIAGILSAVAAIIAFMPPGTKFAVKGNSAAMIGIYMVITASFLRACMGISYKFAFQAGADPAGIPLVNGACWVIGGLIYALAREKTLTFTRKIAGYGILSGALISGIVYFMALMLSVGPATITLSISQMSFIVTFVMSILFLKEKITKRTVFAALLGVLAILCLTLFGK